MTLYGMLDYGQGFDPLLGVKIAPVFFSVLSTIRNDRVLAECRFRNNTLKTSLKSGIFYMDAHDIYHCCKNSLKKGEEKQTGNKETPAVSGCSLAPNYQQISRMRNIA